MLELLQKFNNLPAAVKQAVSTGRVLAEVENLERKYNISLAVFVMRVMVNEIPFKNILANLVNEFNLDPENAADLEKELREKVFFGALDYLESSKIKAKIKEELAEIEEEAQGLDEKRLSAPKRVDLSHLLPEHSAVKSPKKEETVFTFPFEKNKNNSGGIMNEAEEKEISAFSQKIAPKNISEEERERRISGAAAEVAREAGINFPSESLGARFRQIIATFLKGAREKIAIRETLMKSSINGGVNFDNREADRILAIAQKKKESLEKNFVSGLARPAIGKSAPSIFSEEEIKKALIEKNKISAPPAEYDLAAEIKKGNVKPLVPIAPVKELIAPPPPVKIMPAKAPSASAAPLPPLKNLPNIPIKTVPPVSRTANVASNKQRMEDVRMPKIMSPIDELAYMDLVNFRRLDQNPRRRTAKIAEKIELLSKEGIDKKIAGIKAWRQNPVSKTYLSMGHESIAENKPISAIIEERKSKDLNYLDNEEFEAIMDLNNTLRF